MSESIAQAPQAALATPSPPTPDLLLGALVIQEVLVAMSVLPPGREPHEATVGVGTRLVSLCIPSTRHFPGTQ